MSSRLQARSEWKIAPDAFPPATIGSMRNAQHILNGYVPLVEFLGKALGSGTEIVLHDLTVPDESIVAIANGHISGRAVGGPVTNLALWFMKQSNQGRTEEVSGYRAVNSQGRVCRSSSFFIHDDDGNLCGMLCINVDISDLLKAEESIATLMGTIGQNLTPAQPGETSSRELAASPADTPPVATRDDDPSTQVVMEDLKSSLQTLIDSMLDTAIAAQRIEPDRMNSEERIAVIADLEEAGFFLLKGGIAAAAERLGVSEPTIYRYLVKVRK